MMQEDNDLSSQEKSIIKGLLRLTKTDLKMYV